MPVQAPAKLHATYKTGRGICSCCKGLIALSFLSIERLRILHSKKGAPGPDFVFSDDGDAQFVRSAYAALDVCVMAIFVIYAFHFVNRPKIFILREP